MVEIKTFLEVANNVNKVGKEEGVVLSYPITYKHGFAGFLPPSPFRSVVSLSLLF